MKPTGVPKEFEEYQGKTIKSCQRLEDNLENFVFNYLLIRFTDDTYLLLDDDCTPCVLPKEKGE